ncbi:MAG: orotidine-5'-phosphate decarboxylase [Acidithiobacillus sp.]|uniref:orotidine-5'-phosphate decarboxylase n=1 Tax=Acidithiobacillus sp. TaxID=1872118 RepID=UPI003D04AFB7
MTARIIVALDYADAAQAIHLAQRLDPTRCRLKVGKELFTACGPVVVERLQAMGFAVFLDLKFHDIPQTVARASRAAARLGVWMMNLHASGGSRMMAAAREAIDQESHHPLLIAVTVLTSMDGEGLREIGVFASPLSQVHRLANLAAHAGMDGVVCSAQEATLLRQAHPRLLLVTPGIRPAQSAADDQRRILTPAQALRAGADHLVVGRPITAAADPAKALADILAEMDGASAGGG